jgi:NAD(P)H-hydrate epimerase
LANPNLEGKKYVVVVVITLINVDGVINHNATWNYPQPTEASRQVQGYIAFWREVQVKEGYMAGEKIKMPALTTEQMVEVDRLMIDGYGITLIQMMENAGRNLAELARRMLEGQLRGRQITVLCGSGNNSGGGMVAARHLSNWSAKVRIVLATEPEGLKEIPALQWQILQAMGLDRNDEPDLGKADLILDAMLGYGITGDPRGRIADWIGRTNNSGRPVLALDTPSGLDTTTGIPGNPCLRATATLTLALPKIGLLSTEAKPFVGRLYLGDISVPPGLYQQIGIKLDPLFAGDTILTVR